MRSQTLIAFLGLALAACVQVPHPSQALHPSQAATETAAAFRLSSVEKVAQITGEKSVNATDRYGVNGTDLGIIFEQGGIRYMAFGDSFGAKVDGGAGPGGENWRSNLLAVVAPGDFSQGLRFSSMIADARGRAREIIPSMKVDGKEITAIPTAGFSREGSMYLLYMSVRRWGSPGRWTCNYAGLARSDTKGQDWEVLASPRWRGEGGFVQFAAAPLGDFIYLWATPSGRFGAVSLARVERDRVEEAASYRYFAGSGPLGPRWDADPHLALPIVPAPVGELSVVWNEYLGAWIMGYLNETTAALELRSAPEPWGPWSLPLPLCSSAYYPQLYGAFMERSLVEEGGKTIYFAMSQFAEYNVFWMRARLDKIAADRGQAP